MQAKQLFRSSTSPSLTTRSAPVSPRSVIPCRGHRRGLAVDRHAAPPRHGGGRHRLDAPPFGDYVRESNNRLGAMQARALERLLIYMKNDRGGRVCDQSATREECLRAWALPPEIPPPPPAHGSYAVALLWPSKSSATGPMMVVTVDMPPTMMPKAPRERTAQRPSSVRFCGTRSARRQKAEETACRTF